MEHRINVKVYYEDTDALGLVYHANYLRWFERGRWEWVEASGDSLLKWSEAGLSFVVYKMDLRFQAPAHLGELCLVVTRLEGGTPYRRIFHQEVWREDQLLVKAEVHLACIGANRKALKFPEAFKVPSPARSST